MATPRVLIITLITLLSATVISCKPTCPIVSCQVRMVHPHGEQEFRGQPIWKKQHPKMGEKLPKTSQEKVPNRKDNSRNKN